MRAAAAALWVASCAAGHPRPDVTVLACRRALAADDPAAAYALLSDQARDGRSPAAFHRAWRETAGERREQQRALARRNRPVELRADARAGVDDVALREEGGFWRIQGGPVPGQPARTPEEAVRLLVRAVERNDLSAFLRLLSAPAAEQVQRRIRERLERLKAALHRPIPSEGDRATLQYDAKFRIELVREGDEWRIADFD